MKKNILIVHYNTPLLTEKLIISVNKYVSDASIYIFDNSDKQPIKNKWDNVTIFDNTKGQIINFNQWLSKYPNRMKSTSARNNNFASAKHCYSVEVAMNLIKEPFILLDSDVLVKKDFSSLYDENIAYYGDVREQDNKKIRVLPYICYINTPFCNEHNIHYFDETKMCGLFFNQEGDRHDTGSSFYYNSVDYPHKELNHTDYVVHYKAGSWYDPVKASRKNITPTEWLNANKRYWANKENNKVVYTCITGGYDELIDPKKVDSEFDYVCFTDNDKLQSKVWEIRPMPKETENIEQKKKQRFVKINPHIVLNEYDISIWVDGNIEVRDTLKDFVEQNMTNEISVAIPKHPERNCVYDEAVACKRYHKDKDEIINKQMSEYKKEGMPAKYGLPQSNVILRKHNDQTCIKLMEAWWNEVCNKSIRDQLSFTYALWKNRDIKVKYIDQRTYQSKLFYTDMLHKTTKKPGHVINENNKTVRVATPWFYR